MGNKPEELVDSKLLAREMQDRLNTARKNKTLPVELRVEEVTFDDGVWRVRVTPKKGEINTSRIRGVLSGIESDVLEDQGINTAIVRAKPLANGKAKR